MPCLKKQNFNLGQVLHLVIRGLTLELLRTPLGPFADIVDQDQTAQNVQSDLGSRSTLSDKEIVLHPPPPPPQKKNLKKKPKTKKKNKTSRLKYWGLLLLAEKFYISCSAGQGLTPSQTSPSFYLSADKSLENTVGKGKNFSFFQSVFYLFSELCAIAPFSSILKIVVCKLFQFGRV